MLAAVVALCTNTRPDGSAPRKPASSSRAPASAVGSSRLKKRTGLLSIRCRQDCCSSRTGVGTAPYDPWLRWATVGSSGHMARISGQSSPHSGLVVGPAPRVDGSAGTRQA